MIRKIFLLCCLLCVCHIVLARHIKGGWIQYEYQGVGSATNTSIYKITVYVFKDCSQSGPMPSSLGIYDAVTYTNVTSISTNSYTLVAAPSKTTFDPCLSTPYPTICYQIYTYSTTVTLANNANGYIIAASDANRVAGIINIASSSSTGISFTATIPGTISGTDYHVNSNPYFQFKDTAVICYSTKFNYQFTATDADGDSLSYALGDGINGTQTLSSPPYSALTYNTGFSGAAPLGSAASINPITGLISGTAPPTTGEYVIAVYVTEWRNGIAINTTKKELQITVANCSLSAASLKVSYINCDSFSFTFQNESTSSSITSYEWDFGVTASIKDTSTQATPTYVYADTGVYTLKLKVANSGGCQDSATATVRVFPGFTPAFTIAGSCYQSPFQFTDATYVKYGAINSWVWDFGDASTTNDTSSIKNPTYQYSTSGNVTATLNVTSSKGCSGSISKTVVVNDKPLIVLPFKDTLICSIDSVPLIANSNGNYLWTPDYNILNRTSNNPIVFPKDTTVYTVTVTDKGCTDSAKITVNVLDFIAVKFVPDTLYLCKTDSVTLSPISDALSYKWTELNNDNSLNSYTVKYPKASPSVTSTTYHVAANLGYCQASSNVTILASPYPIATVSTDTAICFGSRIQLKGSYTGAYYNWYPTNSMLNSTTLNPIVGPVKTTDYVLTVGDTFYCKKTVSDTVTVRVIPAFTVNAGNDTAVVLNQPLQLLAMSSNTANLSYQWYSSMFLSNAYINNPVATITYLVADTIQYKVVATTPEGCTASDNITIKVFKIAPDILVPTGFTPNNDARNDVLKPILIGIAKLNYFNVYNRWGQMIYATSENNKGWDGTINGTQQPSGTYVFIAQGIDYMGNTIFRKGTTVLIR